MASAATSRYFRDAAILVLLQTVVNYLTKQVFVCPCQVFDLDHKLGPNPVHAAQDER